MAQANLLRDGVEKTAEYVMRLLQGRGHHIVVVRKFGKVAVYRPSRLDDAKEAENIVGQYTSSVPPEVVEGDLLVRLRELSAYMAACEEPCHG